MMNRRRGKFIFTERGTKYLGKTTNRAVNDLVTFQVQLEKIKSSLKKQFSSLK